ncbi:MAG: hypothetical protein HQM09_07265 [Candidatus Riflebacteria bacterium]|nr:hypothetical protein [Candidatus Riflebacteria bacterium]
MYTPRRYLPIIIFTILWLLFTLIGASRFLNDPGTFFHTAAGLDILNKHTLPETDTFTFTRSGTPWIASQWFAEISMAVLYKLGNLDALLLTGTLLLAAIYSALTLRYLNSGIHPLISAFLIALVLASSTHHFLLRPHLLSIALMAFLMVGLSDIDHGRRNFKYIFAYFPLFIFWTNTHGAVLGGIATLFLTIIGWHFMRFLEMHSPIPANTSSLYIFLPAILCAAALLINPYGFRLISTLTGILDSPAVANLIIEHRPLLSKWYGWFTVMLGAIYTLFLAGVPRKSLRMTYFLPVIWFLLAWGRLRHAPLFAVTAAVALTDIILVSQTTAFLFKHGVASLRLSPVQGSSDKYHLSPAIPGILLIVGLLLQSCAIPLPLLGKGIAFPDPTHWPVDIQPVITSFVEKSPPDTRIFNEMLFGGYLTLMAPRLKIFMDDRCELHGEAGLLQYAKAANSPECIKEWERLYRFRAALVIPGSGYDSYFRTTPGWRLEAESDAAALFIASSTP